MPELSYVVLIITGCLFSALAITYRLGHTVGYKQAERLACSYYEKATEELISNSKKI